MKNIESIITSFLLIILTSCNLIGVEKVYEINTSDSIQVNQFTKPDFDDCKFEILDTISRNSSEMIINYVIEDFDTHSKSCWFSLSEEIVNIVPDSGLNLLKVFIWDIDKIKFSNLSQKERNKFFSNIL